MEDEEIRNWIREQMNRGYSRSDIRESLKESGWDTSKFTDLLEHGTERRSSGTNGSGGKSSGKFWIVSALFVLVIGSLAGYYYLWYDTGPEEVTTLTSNPDLIMNVSNTSSQGGVGYGNWMPGGLFIYEDGPLPQNSEHSGIVAMHPQNASVPSKLSREFDLLDSDSANLSLVVSNIAKLISRECISNCTDSVLKVKIRNLSSSETDTLDSRVLTPDEGWVSLNYDISEYSGQGVEIIAEGWGGGPCADFCGEWTAVDYFDVKAA